MVYYGKKYRPKNTMVLFTMVKKVLEEEKMRMTPDWLCPKNVRLSENVFIQKFSPKNAKFEAEISQCLWGAFRDKIEILSKYNLLCRKFAAVCQNSVVNLQCQSVNCNYLHRM